MLDSFNIGYAVIGKIFEFLRVIGQQTERATATKKFQHDIKKSFYIINFYKYFKLRLNFND